MVQKRKLSTISLPGLTELPPLPLDAPSRFLRIAVDD